MNEAIISLSNNDLDSLIALIKLTYGFDFSNYSKVSLKRRFERLLGINSWQVADLKQRIIDDSDFFDVLLREITVNVTEMFRDPNFYKSLVNNVLPYLNTYQRIKVWNAGISSGEELYSFAILFDEYNLLEKSFFYGTDINTEVLEEAKAGIYSLKKIRAYADNYVKIGLKSPFSKYFTVNYHNSIIKNRLKENVLFSVHNLLSDGIFNEFQLISCRNVLIYFDVELQSKVLELFINSLGNFGFLCLGSKETVRSPQLLKRLKVIDHRQNIYQRIK